MINKKTLSILVASVFASGCSQMHTDDFKQIRDTNNEATNEIDSLKSQSVAEINGGSTLNEFYVKTTPVKVKARDAILLPDFLPPEIYMYSATPMAEKEIAQTLYDDYAIKVVFERLIQQSDEQKKEEISAKEDKKIEADEKSGAQLSEESGGKTKIDEGAPLMQDMLSLFGNSIDKDNAFDKRVQKIDYDGDIIGFFNWLALDRGLSWRYDEDTDTFVLYDLDTVVFELIDNSDKLTYESTVDTSSDSNAGSADGAAKSTSNSAQKSTLSEEAEHWDDLQAMIRQMLSPNGSAAFDLKNGRVAVTDTKQALQKIGTVIEKINLSSGTQVVLNVTYVKVSIEEGSEISTNVSATDLVSGAVEGGAKLGEDLTKFGNIFNLSFTKSGVDAMIGSLGSLGSISYRFDSPILTMNNHLTPFQSVEEEHYIAEVEVETDEDGNETKSPTKEVNKTGITSTWKNRVVNDRVIVDGKLSLVENLYMKVEDKMNNIVLPKNALDNHNITAMLRNGETRVVSIQEINRKVAESKGPMGADSFILGGSEKTKSRREVSVVLVTPYIIK